MTAQRIIAGRAEASNAIHTLADTGLVEVRGDERGTGALLRQKETDRGEAVDGVFVFAGLEPNTEWLGGLVDLDSAGHIVTDISPATSVPGVFAAGDVRQFSAAQLAASAGDGATAAVSADRGICHQPVSSHWSSSSSAVASWTSGEGRRRDCSVQMTLPRAV
ncbi:NAD(P)/FAD-dependent oxidoreductase [Streptomyces tendae]|uniref:NAD(P)/FAD-dependent oxidoreductase n=1 Tax=Streptomyces tendae TaxID=1932 RepID=UPI0033A35A29